MIHAPRPASLLGNLLDVLIVSCRIFAKHDHFGSLLDASGLDRVVLIELRNDLAIHHEWLGSSRLSGLAVTRLEGILLGRLVAKVVTATLSTSSTETAIIQPPLTGSLLALVRALGLMMAGGAGIRVMVVASLILGLGHFGR